MKSCAKCLIPETAEATTFDDTGTCSVCRQIEFKEEKVDWVERRNQLEELIAPFRGKGALRLYCALFRRERFHLPGLVYGQRTKVKTASRAV